MRLSFISRAIGLLVVAAASLQSSHAQKLYYVPNPQLEEAQAQYLAADAENRPIDLTTIEAGIKLADLHLARGEIADHLRTLEDLYNRVVTDLGSDHPSSYRLSNALLESYREYGGTVQSDTLLKRVILQNETSFGALAPETLDAKLALARDLLARGERVASDLLIKEISAQASNHFQPSDPIRLRIRFYEIGDLAYEEQSQAYRSLYDQQAASLGAQHPATVLTLQAALILTDEPADFERLKQIYLAATQDLYGLDDGRMVYTVLLAASFNDPHEAAEDKKIPELIRFYETQKSELGDAHPALINTLELLGLYMELKSRNEIPRRTSQKAKYLKAAIDLKQEHYGDLGPNLILARNELAGIYFREQSFGEARPIYEKLLEEIEAGALETKQIRADVYGNLADIYVTEGPTKTDAYLADLYSSALSAKLETSYYGLGASDLVSKAETYLTKTQDYERLVDTFVGLIAFHEAKDANVLRRQNTAGWTLVLARAYAGLGQDELAIATYKKAATYESSGLGDSINLALGRGGFSQEVMGELGRFYALHGDWESADPLLRDLFRMHEETISKVLSLDADRLTYWGLYDEAEKKLNEGLRILDRYFEPNHTTTHSLRHSLGKIYIKQQRFDDAALVLQALYAERLDEFGAADEKLIRIEGDLLSALAGADKLETARPIYQRLFDRFEDSTPHYQQEKIAKRLVELAQLELRRMDHQAANSTIKRLYALEALDSPRRPAIGAIANASTELAQAGKLSENRDLLMAGLRVGQTLDHVSPDDLSPLFLRLSIAHEALGLHKEAEDILLEAVAYFQPADPLASQHNAVLIDHLANFYLDQKRYEDALPLAQKVLVFVEADMPSTPASQLVALSSIAAAQLGVGQTSEADQTLTRIWKTSETSLKSLQLGIFDEWERYAHIGSIISSSERLASTLVDLNTPDMAIAFYDLAIQAAEFLPAKDRHYLIELRDKRDALGEQVD